MLSETLFGLRNYCDDIIEDDLGTRDTIDYRENSDKLDKLFNDYNYIKKHKIIPNHPVLSFIIFYLCSICTMS